MKKRYLIALLPLLVACGGQTGTSENFPVEKPSETTPVTDFKIVGPESVAVGDVVTYKVDKDISVDWSSSDVDVLEINSKGEAVTYKEGQVTITAKDKNSEQKATFDVKVENTLTIPNDEMGMSQLFQTIYEKEMLANEFSFRQTDTDIKQEQTRNAKMYDANFFVEEYEDKYENYSGQHHDIETRFKGIDENYYTEVVESNKKGLALRMKIVDENPSNIQITREDAIKRASQVGYASSFYTKLSDMWTSERTLDLSIVSEKTEDGFKLQLNNYYLFIWANGTSNDCRGYEATLDVAADGFLKSAKFTTITYEDSQWDVSNNKLKDDAVVRDTETIEYAAIRGDKYPASSSTFHPEEYFVTSVSKAVYQSDAPVKVGDNILRNNIVIEEYQGPKALDLAYFNITSVEKVDEKDVVAYDPITGQYTAIGVGKAKLVCQMIMSEDVTFTVDINVEPTK